jgi:hypothetical protein
VPSVISRLRADRQIVGPQSRGQRLLVDATYSPDTTKPTATS